MSAYDRDAPLYAQPPLSREQVQRARADYEVMRATTWRWGDGRLMTEYEMMYIAAASSTAAMSMVLRDSWRR